MHALQDIMRITTINICLFRMPYQIPLESNRRKEMYEIMGASVRICTLENTAVQDCKPTVVTGYIILCVTRIFHETYVQKTLSCTR